MPARLAMLPARMVIAVSDLPIRWLMTFLDGMNANRGYVTVGSLVGGYLVVFGLIDARHQQEESRANFDEQ